MAELRLRLTSMCSVNPALTRRWRVRNSNPYAVSFRWEVYGTSQTGTGVVPAAVNGIAGERFFETQSIPNSPNTTRLLVGNTQQDVKASGGALCN